MLLACLYPEMVDQLIVADIAPKTYPSHHQMILNGLASLDFSIIKSRKEADEALAEFVKDMGTRQFLLKNIYRISPNQLGLRLNIDVLKNASEQIGETMGQELVYHGKTLFLKGKNSSYIEDEDELLIRHHFPAAKIIRIENAGHWLHAENPTEFARAIENWW
jgi:pimeloyl-ACP methyl ester carboxylesterase